jgi:hypothetical protein
MPKALFAAKTMQLRNLPLETTGGTICRISPIARVTYMHRAAVSGRKLGRAEEAVRTRIGIDGAAAFISLHRYCPDNFG